MLTEEQNKILTQVGPGTPGGELLRRYWHPIVAAQELTEQAPTKHLRVLGEDLVLFRDLSGRVGLIADRCPHRRASLLYGRVEKRGIACAYHGWLMDCEGTVLERPAEKDDRGLKGLKTTAYPVQKFLGLYWTYMGPQPVPVLPKYDIFMRRDGRHKLSVYPRLDCNWFAAAENSVDSTHLQFLHQEPPNATHRPENTTRGYIDDIDTSEYRLLDYGIMKKRIYHGGFNDEHPMIFPLWLRTRGAMWMRTPIDDEHTNHWVLSFTKTDGPALVQDEIEVEYIAPFKDPPDALYPEATFEKFPKHGWPLCEDVIMWETQGVVADRTKEHLGNSDKGVALLRKVMFEEIEKVQRGEDPMGVVRDERVIDTNLEASLTMRYPTGTKTKTVPIKESV
jgi:5,5'-dehydrodivanillate O-demethylase oxygenase subunit